VKENKYRKSRNIQYKRVARYSNLLDIRTCTYWVNKAEVSSAGDNDAQHVVDNKCKSSDTACVKCEESENKLQETLLELS
jgi:hypothetical protein